MKKVLLLSFLILIFGSINFSQSKAEKLSDARETIVDVNFCDLFENPSDYANKIVRVTGIYRFGYEWSDFYCLSCKKLIWLNRIEEDEKKTKKKSRKKIKWSEAGKTVKVTAVGEFKSGGGFGHLGGYKHEFVVHYFEKIAKVSKSSEGYQALSEKDKAKANCETESQKK